MSGYPGTSFPNSVDIINPVGPEGGSVQAPNSQGETHAGIHAQLAAATMAVQSYLLSGGAGTPGLGQGAASTPVTLAKRGDIITAGASTVLPLASAVGAGFVVAVFNPNSASAIAITPTAGDAIYKSGGGFNSITLNGNESVILMALPSLSAWVVVGGIGLAAAPQAYAPTVAALTDGANIATDASLGNDFTVTILGNRNFTAPTNPTNGQKILYQITQGAGGPWTPTWDAIFDFGGISPSYSTGAGQVDYLLARYDSTRTKWDVLSFAAGY